MDARFDVLRVLGLDVGDAHVLRNAGARVTEDVTRSLCLSVGVLGVTRVIVLQHSACGVFGVTDAELRSQTGTDYSFRTFDDHRAALREDIDMIVSQPFSASLTNVSGAVLDIERMEVRELVRWGGSRPAHAPATSQKHEAATLTV